mmetsp:Transcript_62718/g.115340  ORF Transcript_62718/g.115340 Transcript_62718/m.115340 type:complete len:330 (-) Transcript_62718:271-1260(-)
MPLCFSALFKDRPLTVINIALESFQDVVTFVASWPLTTLLRIEFRRRQLFLDDFFPETLTLQSRRTLRHVGRLNLVDPEELAKENSKPFICLMFLWNAFDHDCCCSGQRQRLQPVDAPVHELVHDTEDVHPHSEDHGPDHSSIHPIEPASILHIAHGQIAQVVVACGVASKRVIHGPHDEEHGQTEDCQDPHAHCGELYEHCLVKAHALSNLINTNTQGSPCPSKPSVRYFIGLNFQIDVVAVHHRKPAPGKHEESNAEDNDGQICDQCSKESLQVAFPVQGHARGFCSRSWSFVESRGRCCRGWSCWYRGRISLDLLLLGRNWLGLFH